MKQLRNATSGQWILNHGTATQHSVVASSGNANGMANADWKVLCSTVLPLLPLLLPLLPLLSLLPLPLLP
jgi:hypothetical protein